MMPGARIETSAIDVMLVATELVDAATREGLPLRVAGGVAFRMRCPSSTRERLTRSCGDIDLCGVSRAGADYQTLFEDFGYEPSLPFNRLNAMVYQRFDHREQPIHVDLFLDRLRMCHELPFKDRFDIDDYTLSPADLLLTKLQIVQLNEKDIQDIVALLLDYELGETDDREQIFLSRITGLFANDWGWWRTSSETLTKCQAWLDGAADDPGLAGVRASLTSLMNAIDAAPKSFKWKARAKVGDRVRWYELPEDPTRA